MGECCILHVMENYSKKKTNARNKEMLNLESRFASLFSAALQRKYKVK